MNEVEASDTAKGSRRAVLNVVQYISRACLDAASACLDIPRAFVDAACACLDVPFDLALDAALASLDTPSALLVDGSGSGGVAGPLPFLSRAFFVGASGGVDAPV
jgi:hypothetical protein